MQKRVCRSRQRSSTAQRYRANLACCGDSRGRGHLPPGLSGLEVCPPPAPLRPRASGGSGARCRPPPLYSQPTLGLWGSPGSGLSAWLPAAPKASLPFILEAASRCLSSAALCLIGLSTGHGWHTGKPDHCTKFSEQPEPPPRGRCCGHGRDWNRPGPAHTEGAAARVHVRKRSHARVCVRVHAHGADLSYRHQRRWPHLLPESKAAPCRHLHTISPAREKARQRALTVTTAGQRSFRCRSRGTRLWCTWVRRPISSLPAAAATRSPNNAMAAARIPSRSCKTGAQSRSQTCLGPSPCGGDGAQVPQQSPLTRSGAPGQGRASLSGPFAGPRPSTRT